VEEEWPLMEQRKSSLRGRALSRELTMSLEVPDPRTDAEQALCDHGLTEGGGPSGDR
jgi:hypothetical protein